MSRMLSHAVLIASESFFVDGSAYTDEQTFQGGENNVNGNTGFSTGTAWNTNTGTIRIDDDVTAT